MREARVRVSRDLQICCYLSIALFPRCTSYHFISAPPPAGRWARLSQIFQRQKVIILAAEQIIFNRSVIRIAKQRYICMSHHVHITCSLPDVFMTGGGLGYGAPKCESVFQRWQWLYVMPDVVALDIFSIVYIYETLGQFPDVFCSEKKKKKIFLTGGRGTCSHVCGDQNKYCKPSHFSKPNQVCFIVYT